ncbi:MAG: hypothetical protein GC192_09975 [Bacteroidetes bacterium]|nr:hypothetical protein [Bacteroidota bacterium]
MQPKSISRKCFLEVKNEGKWGVQSTQAEAQNLLHHKVQAADIFPTANKKIEAKNLGSSV